MNSKNKPKTNPIQTQYKPNQTQYKPNQTQYKPNQTQNKPKTNPIEPNFYELVCIEQRRSVEGNETNPSIDKPKMVYVKMEKIRSMGVFKSGFEIANFRNIL